MRGLVRLQALEVREAERRAEVFAQVHPVLFRDRQEYIHDLRIELRSGAAANLFAGMGNGQCLAVGSIADHRVERIGNRKYSCAEGNLLSFEPTRITGAIEKFLVRQHDFSCIP